jgi:hypothetical protein
MKWGRLEGSWVALRPVEFEFSILRCRKCFLGLFSCYFISTIGPSSGKVFTTIVKAPTMFRPSHATEQATEEPTTT